MKTIMIIAILCFFPLLKALATNNDHTPLLKEVNLKEQFCRDPKNYYKIEVKNGQGRLTLVGDKYEEPGFIRIGIVSFSTEIKKFENDKFFEDIFPDLKLDKEIVSAKTYGFKDLGHSNDETINTLMFAKLSDGDEVAIFFPDEDSMRSENYGVKSKCKKR